MAAPDSRTGCQTLQDMKFTESTYLTQHPSSFLRSSDVPPTVNTNRRRKQLHRHRDNIVSIGLSSLPPKMFISKSRTRIVKRQLIIVLSATLTVFSCSAPADNRWNIMWRIPRDEYSRCDHHWRRFKHIEVPLVCEEVAKDTHNELRHAVDASDLNANVSPIPSFQDKDSH